MQQSPSSPSSFNLSTLKLKLQAQASGKPFPPPATPPAPEKTEAAKIAMLKKQWQAHLASKGVDDKPPRRRFKRRPPGPDAFTEVERAILLRNVIDALRARSFLGSEPYWTVWRRYGLSRIYFDDGSWLSYDAQGTAIYGPSKKTVAYGVRCEFKLTRRARKGALKD